MLGQNFTKRDKRLMLKYAKQFLNYNGYLKKDVSFIHVC
jgi:hypothetical protein